MILCPRAISIISLFTRLFESFVTVEHTHTHTPIFTLNSKWNTLLWFLFVVVAKPGTTNHKKWKFN